MKYKDFNDQQLISYVSENNEHANEILFEKYRPLITSLAYKIYKNCKYSGLEVNDFMQEGYLGLNIALKNYDIEKEASFYTFAKTVIERRMISLAISTNRLKHKFLNESISFDVSDNLTGEIINLENIIGDSSVDPETLVINKLEARDFKNKINNELTSLERQVFFLRIDNFDYIEIAKMIGKTPKSIDNALQRIKTKVRKIMNESK